MLPIMPEKVNRRKVLKTLFRQKKYIVFINFLNYNILFVEINLLALTVFVEVSYIYQENNKQSKH